MKKITVLFSFLFTGFCFSQNNSQKAIDSLKMELSKQKESEVKVNTLNFLSENYFKISQTEEALIYSDKAVKLATKINYNNGLAQTYSNIGNIQRYQGNNKEALLNYNLALDIYKKLNDKEKIAKSANSIGIVYAEQGKAADAAANFHTALKIYKEIGNKNEIAQSYNKLGVLYSRQKNITASLENFERALEMFKEQNDKNSMGMTYHNISIAHYSKKDYDKALKNSLMSLELLDKLGGDKYKEASIHQHIGNIYADQNRQEDALEAQQKALKIFEEINYISGIGSSYLNIGSIFHDLKEVRKAKQWFKKGLDLNEKDYETVLKIDFYKNLYAVETSLGNFKDALNYHVLYKTYSDSLYNQENTIALTQAKMNYDFEQKEALIKAEQEAKDALSREALTKEKNNRNLALGGIGFFVVVAGFSGFAYVQKRKDNKIISAEKQKSDDLLLNILPAEIAKELKEKGTSEAKHFDSVSIMFTDFKEFTKLSEIIPSTELIKELNYCFKEFDNIITKHGVEKIKTIGDSYMAVCGLPARSGNHAQKMVDAALEIRDFIEKYKEKRQEEGKTYFEMRIGINSGEVVAGIVGIKKFAYDIWGDAVNTASRMESNGEIGKVNISEATYNLVKNDFSFDYRGEMDAKGKGKIKMYFVEPKEENV